VCPCPPDAIASAASTPCARANALGTCEGERICGAEGLSACSAAEPAAESCNGVDDDCDGATDEGLVGDACTRANGFGVCAGFLVCGADGAAVCSAPEPAAEVCNGQDDDCDGEVDEPGAAGCAPLYLDGDGDGYGVGAAVCACAANAEASASVAGDCDDASPDVNPGEPEVCNGADDDCDGDVDEPGAAGCAAWLADEDGDGYGDDGASACLCAAAGTYTTQEGGDCDDLDGAVHPGAPEVCNGKDDDCDGEVDPADAGGCTAAFFDGDGDGWGQAGTSRCVCVAEAPYSALLAGDCDDTEPLASPALVEACDGIDNDCDGAVDEGAASGCALGWPDSDGDGVGALVTPSCVCPPLNSGLASATGDCDDGNANKSPLLQEVCNGADDDCDTQVDEPGAQGCAARFKDGDGDGYGQSAVSLCVCNGVFPFTASQGGDCNDGTAAVSPDADELCNGTDDDCDGEIDEALAAGCTAYYQDADGDGWGNPAVSECLCAASGLFTSKKVADCADGDASVSPSTAEACNGIDDDCDGSVDEAGAAGCTELYLDADGDGYGVVASKVCACGPEGDVDAPLGGDCNDAAAATSPGATEACNAVDDDCDGVVDEGCGLASTGWPTYKYDGRRTGHRPDVNGPLSAQKTWSVAFSPGLSIDNSPVIVDDGIIVARGTKASKLSFTGQTLWTIPLPGSVGGRTSPTVRQGGTILLPAGDRLLLLRPDGSTIWSVQFPGETMPAAPLVTADGSIYVLASAGLRKLDGAGQVQWITAAPNTQVSPGHPAVSPNGRIHFATSNHSVYAVIPETGQAAWVYTHPQGFDTDSSVAVAPNGDVFQGFGNTVARLSPLGAVLQTVGVGGDMDGDVSLWVNPTTAALAVYVNPNGNTGVRRYSDALALQWTFSLTKDGSFNGVPVLDADADVYVGGDDGKFVCVNAAGQGRWTYTTAGSTSKSAAAIGQGFVVFGDSAGNVVMVGEVSP
jgi:outer membrane protein assembly factor BamB